MKKISAVTAVSMALLVGGCVTPKKPFYSEVPAAQKSIIYASTFPNESNVAAGIWRINGQRTSGDTWMYEIPENTYNLEVKLAIGHGSDFGAFVNIMSGLPTFKVTSMLYTFESIKLERQRTYRLVVNNQSGKPQVCMESRASSKDEVQSVKSKEIWKGVRKEACGKFFKIVE